jgi:hypothetical protein
LPVSKSIQHGCPTRWPQARHWLFWAHSRNRLLQRPLSQQVSPSPPQGGATHRLAMQTSGLQSLLLQHSLHARLHLCGVAPLHSWQLPFTQIPFEPQSFPLGQFGSQRPPRQVPSPPSQLTLFTSSHPVPAELHRWQGPGQFAQQAPRATQRPPPQLRWVCMQVPPTQLAQSGQRPACPLVQQVESETQADPHTLELGRSPQLPFWHSLQVPEQPGPG